MSRVQFKSGKIRPRQIQVDKPSIADGHRNFFVRRPKAVEYEKAHDLWKATLARFGQQGLARVERAWRASRRSAVAQHDQIVEISRKSSYAGIKSLDRLLRIAHDSRIPKQRDQLLDIIETVRRENRKIDAMATLERIWPNGSMAFSVQHGAVGWLDTNRH